MTIQELYEEMVAMASEESQLVFLEKKSPRLRNLLFRMADELGKYIYEEAKNEREDS